MATGPDPRLNAARTLGEAWASLLAAIDRHWAATAPVPDQPETMPVLPRDDPRSSRSIARAADDLRYGITALGDPGEIAELLDALDTALEDYRARCFTNDHVIYGQYCDIQTEYEYRDHDEFPPESFPLRREAWASFRDRLDRFIAGRPGPLAVCVRLGFGRRAIECQLDRGGGPFGPWRQWPTPADAPHPFLDLREQLDRIRTWCPQLDGEALDLTEGAYRSRSEPPSAPGYERWALQRCTALVDRIVHDPDLVQAVRDAGESSAGGPTPEPAPTSVVRVYVMSEGPLQLMTDASHQEPFCPQGRVQTLLLGSLVDAKFQSTYESRPEAAIVTCETVNQLCGETTVSQSEPGPRVPSRNTMSAAARAALGRLRKALKAHLGPPRGGQYIETHNGQGISLSRQIRWRIMESTSRVSYYPSAELERMRTRDRLTGDHQPGEAGGGRRRRRPRSSDAEE